MTPLELIAQHRKNKAIEADATPEERRAIELIFHYSDVINIDSRGMPHQQLDQILKG